MMKSIPNVIECYYCERNQTHGGSCLRKQGMPEKGCLGFKADERGCIRSRDITIHTPIYQEFPEVNVWQDEWEMNGIETEIRIEKIHGIKWDKTKGNLVVSCRCSYFVNDFADDYKEVKVPQAVLRVIK